MSVDGDAAIRLEGLTKYYGTVVGIEDLSFTVAPGEVYGFLGANGAGKTTTIRLLLDLLRPTRGRASVLGIDCHRDSLAARRRIGYLPGDLPIYPDLTAGEYLAYLSRLDSRPVPPDYLRHLLARFDVSEIDQRRPLRDQSHGMKQKIGIVQALMTRPPVVVLDEPTAGLDPFMVHAFRETIDAIRRDGRSTVFLSSHVLTEVEATCDRVGIIRAGRIVHVTALSDLKARAPRRVVVQFSSPVISPPSVAGVHVLSAGPLEWHLEVAGPLERVMSVLGSLPVHDLTVEPFSLEAHVLELYRSSPTGIE